MSKMTATRRFVGCGIAVIPGAIPAIGATT
jgi:hypothetical protein